MPQWKDEIKEHSVHGTLEILRTDVEELIPLPDKDSNDSLKRELQILDKGLKILSGFDPVFVSTSALDAIEANIAAVKTSFNEIKTNPSTPSLHETYFAQMEPQLSQFLMALGQMRSIASPLSQNSAFEKLGYIKLDSIAQADKIKNSFQEEVNEIEESFTQIKEEVVDLTTSVSEEKLRADNLITQFQTEFNTGQKERDSQFKKKLDKEFAERIETTLSDSKSEFELLQEKTDKKIESLDSNADRLIKVLNDYATKPD